MRIKKKIVHAKSEEYNGADLYIEVEGKKFALVQFKLASGNRFQFDQNQIKNLGIWCRYCTQDAVRPILCPSFVWLTSIIYNDFEKHRILRLCQLKSILHGRSSAKVDEFNHQGITRNTFRELLAKCWEGAPFKRKPSTQDLLDYSEALRRLIVAFNIST